MLNFCAGVAFAVTAAVTGLLFAAPIEAASVDQQSGVVATHSVVLATGSTAPQNPIDRTQAIVGFAIAGTGAAVIAYSAAHRHDSGKPSWQQRWQAERANPRLQGKLLRLLHDDQETANRLLARVKMHHPDRSADWIVEKVIYDLERDRGR
jgi:hypothetical protein